MKSLRARLIIGFSCCSLGTGFLFAVFIYVRLGGWISHLEIPPNAKETAQSVTPGSSASPVSFYGNLASAVDPSVVGTSGSAVLLDSLRRSLVFESIPVLIAVCTAATVTGRLFAARVIEPIGKLNRRLADFNDSKSEVDIEFPHVDSEFQELFGHFRSILERLTTALKDTREYAAEVAHELRTPLQIIRLKLETSRLMIDPAFSEELQEEIYRLRHVVEQVLLIAKAGRKQLTLQTSRFDISELTRELVEDFRLLASEEGRNLVFRGSGGHFILSDTKYFRQVLHALLSNAMSHGEGEIRIRIGERGGHARLFICNRVRTSPGSRNLSLGLGLRVVKALLSIMPCTAFRRYSGPSVYGVLLEFAKVPPPEISPR